MFFNDFVKMRPKVRFSIKNSAQMFTGFAKYVKQNMLKADFKLSSLF